MLWGIIWLSAVLLMVVGGLVGWREIKTAIDDNKEVIIAIGTVVLAVFTLLLWSATRDLVVDAKDTSRKSLRAWIVPIGASFFDQPKADYFRIRIDIKNTGKEPALSVRQTDQRTYTSEYELNKTGQPYIDSKNIPWPTKTTCDLRAQEPIGPIYPSETTYYIRQGYSDEHFADLDQGRRVIIVYGCFLYGDTFGEERRSPYCFYSVPVAKPFRDWTFAPCLRRTENPQ